MSGTTEDVIVFDFDPEVTKLLEQLSLENDKSADLQKSSAATGDVKKASEHAPKKLSESKEHIITCHTTVSSDNAVASKDDVKTVFDAAKDFDLSLENLSSKFVTALTLNNFISPSTIEFASSSEKSLDVIKSKNQKDDVEDDKNSVCLNSENDSTSTCEQIGIKLVERGRVKSDKYKGKQRLQEYPVQQRLKWDSPEITNQELLSLFAGQEVPNNIDSLLHSNQNVNPIYGINENSGSYDRDLDDWRTELDSSSESGYCTSATSSSVDPLSPQFLSDISELDSYADKDHDVSSSQRSVSFDLPSVHDQINQSKDSISDVFDEQLLTKPQVCCSTPSKSNNKLSVKNTKNTALSEGPGKGRLKKQPCSPEFDAVIPHAPIKTELRKLGFELKTSAKYNLFYSVGFSQDRCRMEYYKIYKYIKEGLLGTEEKKVIHYLENLESLNYRGTNLHFALLTRNIEQLYCFIEIHKQYHKSLFEINLRDSCLKTVLDYAIEMRMNYVISYLKENNADRSVRLRSKPCKKTSLTKT